MRDLDIRGAGNLLGKQQSGFISEIGFDMYMQILDEAVNELKETELADVIADVIPAKPEEKKKKPLVFPRGIHIPGPPDDYARGNFKIRI